jgi:hypothetical protein
MPASLPVRFRLPVAIAVLLAGAFALPAQRQERPPAQPAPALR